MAAQAQRLEPVAQLRALGAPAGPAAVSQSQLSAEWLQAARFAVAPRPYAAAPPPLSIQPDRWSPHTSPARTPRPGDELRPSKVQCVSAEPPAADAAEGPVEGAVACANAEAGGGLGAAVHKCALDAWPVLRGAEPQVQEAEGDVSEGHAEDVRPAPLNA